MSSRNLRPADVRDTDRLMAYIKAYYASDKIPFHPEKIKPALERLLRDDSLGRAWLIQANGDDVGYILATFGYDLEFRGRVATITEFYIRPEHRRSGLGTQTLEWVENSLRSSGVETLELQVERQNRDAIAFYRKNGFHEHNRIPMSKGITGAD